MRIVIVGAGQAGAALAAKARALGHQGEIIMIGAEASPPYQRPPLSKAYLLGDIGVERLWLRSPSFWAEHQIDLRLGQAVSQINPDAKTIRLGDEDIPYDHLVLTTGASPRRLPATMGGDLEGVYTVRSLSDVDRMRAEFQPGRRLIVVGGGYIGLEAAAVARKLGLEVTLLEMAPRILGRVAAAETSGYVADLHRQQGVDLRENTGIQCLLGETRLLGVRLADGQELPADFVILGVGVTPGVELADAAGIACENGIITDAFGQTSDPFIWAAGDCASFPYGGAQIRLESVGNAIDQAEMVAANILAVIAGADPQPYLAKAWFWSDQYDLKLQIAGLNTGYDTLVSRTEGGTSFWYYKGARLIAVDAMSDARAYMVAKRLIEAGKSPTPDQVKSEPDLKVLLK